MIYCRNWEKKVSEYTNIVVSTMYMSSLISDDACNIADNDQLKIFFVACDCLLASTMPLYALTGSHQPILIGFFSGWL